MSELVVWYLHDDCMCDECQSVSVSDSDIKQRERERERERERPIVSFYPQYQRQSTRRVWSTVEITAEATNSIIGVERGISLMYCATLASVWAM